MRSYVVGTSTATKRLRVVVGGKTKSGKTSFAATFPKPHFISDGAEGGADTLQNMDPELWWDKGCPPRVDEIENMMELPQLITKLLEKKSVIKEQTLVVDSISIYAQRVLRELKANNPGQDNRQRYGELGDALQALIGRVHSLPYQNIIWLCHIDDEMQLSVPGKASSVLWAYMGYLWMTHVEAQIGRAPDFQLHTRPYLRATWLGGRSMIAAPSPMIPSFKVLAELLGLPDRPVSPACPDFGGVAYPLGASYLPQE
jgi:hypothetical protein